MDGMRPAVHLHFLFTTFLSVSPKERVQLHGVWVACFDWFFFYFHFSSSLCIYIFLSFPHGRVQLAVLLFVRIINYHPLLWYPGKKKRYWVKVTKKKILGVRLIFEIETEPDARVLQFFMCTSFYKYPFRPSARRWHVAGSPSPSAPGLSQFRPAPWR